MSRYVFKERMRNIYVQMSEDAQPFAQGRLYRIDGLSGGRVPSAVMRRAKAVILWNGKRVYRVEQGRFPEPEYAPLVLLIPLTDAAVKWLGVAKARESEKILGGV